MPRLAKEKPTDQSTATIGFEAKLWLAADTAMRDSANLPCEAILRSQSEARDNRRNNMDAAEPERSGDSQPQAARRASEAKNNMVALTGQLFYSTQIPVCLWIIRENGNANAGTLGLN